MIEALGSFVIGKGIEGAGICRLLGESLFLGLSSLFRFRFRGRATLLQMYLLGVESVPVVAFALLFTSLMLIVEFSFHMKLVLRQDSLVPAFSTVLMVRELGPVVTALLLASRVGAGIAAEVGTMKLTEQLDALRLLSLDPVEYLAVPRWIGCVFATVSLSMVALGVAVLGGAFIASVQLHHPTSVFFNSMFLFTHVDDFKATFLKSIVFGTVIPMTAMFHGFRCRPGAGGVGDAATSAVVSASMLILFSDFVLTYLLYAL
jgi:phospholipid/cholesterol/gamma-HCH transport system permease protein